MLNGYFQKYYEILNKYNSVIKCLSAILHLCYAYFLKLLKFSKKKTSYIQIFFYTNNFRNIEYNNLTAKYIYFLQTPIFVVLGFTNKNKETKNPEDICPLIAY